MNDVWVKIAEFLGRLNGESVSRESYVKTPEYEKALEVWKEKEQEWEGFLETLSAYGKAGRNKGISGGSFFHAGAAGIHSGLCRLCAGTVPHGASGE